MARPLFTCFLLTLALLGCKAEAIPADYALTLQQSDLLVNSGNDGSHWEGWGTSLCWWANRTGYSPVLTEAAAKTFFSAQDGLGLNIMRYNVGGGDDPEHHHITRTDSDVPGWLYLDAGTGAQTYRYDADSCQLNILRAGVKAAGDEAYVEVFSNSPPYFMTNSGCSTGNFKAGENNLRDDAYPAFAEYMAHVTDYMVRTMKLPVKSVSPMNEPNTNYWGAMSNKQEGCHFDAGEAQSRILVETAKALKSKGLEDLVLVASDETNPALQLEELDKYTPEARQVIDRISTHTYSTGKSRELGDRVRQEQLPLWMSETDGANTSGERAGEMGAGLWMAEKIISDIRALRPSAWVMWQVIDTHVSANGWKGRRDSGPVRPARGFWGLAWADHDQQQIFLTQKYYAMGQFTRYIRPGADLILSELTSAAPTESSEAGPAGNKPACQTLSAWNERTGQLTVVLTNASATARTVAVNAAAFGIRKAAVTAYRTSGSMAEGEHWAEIPQAAARKGAFYATLAPNSVTTFVIQK